MKGYLVRTARSSFGAALAGGVVVAVLASLAWANIPDRSGVIHGCYDTSTGALRVIDSDQGATCDATRENSLDWNLTAPPEPDFGARVAADGSLLLSSGVVAVRHPGTGEYAVKFPMDIASCYMSLISNGHPGEISGEPDTADPTVVDVETFDSKGRHMDGVFYLTVSCLK